MQLVISAPPVLSTEEEAELQLAKDRSAFKAEHRDEVLRDFRLARKHAKNGTYTVTVTPQRTVIRTPHPSSVRADLMEVRCRESAWLEELYAENCSDGITIRISVDKMLRAPCNDHLEDIFMLVVTFQVPTSAKKAALFLRTRTT